jgi:DNA-binding NtrC family response regulator
VSARELTTALIEGADPRLEIDEAELRVVAGPDKGARIELGARSLRIGTAADCALILTDPTVSAHHAEIALSSRGYLLRDLGSKNGVRLGGIQIHRAPLQPGVPIQIGATRLSVHGLRGRLSIPLAQPLVVGRLVAHSIAMRAVAASLERVAASDSTVLLEGETGTGKEVAADAIHRMSARAGGPFVVLDCGAVPAALIAGELFGHERGAFTQADHARPGLLESAEGGTLFLDEIGELPLDVQPSLLRAIEQRRSRRLGGGGEERAHDLRVVAATNRNLAEEVRGGRFRQDLYYRLAVVRIAVPPLRERREDIPILAERMAAELGLHLGADLLAALAAHDWPGNVRELKNAIERAAADVAPIDQPAAPRLHPDLKSLAEARRQAADAFERDYLARALAAAGGNLSRAAELAGVSRQLFTQLARKHNMRARDRR